MRCPRCDENRRFYIKADNTVKGIIKIIYKPKEEKDLFACTTCNHIWEE